MKRGDVWRSVMDFPWVVDQVRLGEHGEEVQLRSMRHGSLMRRWWTEKGLLNARAKATGERLTEEEMAKLEQREGVYK